MKDNKTKYDELQQKGVSAQLISTILLNSGLEPRVAKNYRRKTVYSIIHNRVEDKNVANALDYLETICDSGIPDKEKDLTPAS